MKEGYEYASPKVTEEPAPLPNVQFSLPTDSEGKATTLRLYSFARPHMLSFHVNWLGFFISFFGTFAAPPLITYIRDDLNLTQGAVNGANVAAVTSAIICRVFMGSIVTKFGPRFGMAMLLLLTAPAVFGIALCESSTTFVVCRCVIGASLATFVACQYWTSVLFTPAIIGAANAFAGGWGNLGGGVTQLVMPEVYDGLVKHYPSAQAWRWAFFIPGALYIVGAMIVFTLGQDSPYGNFLEIEKKGVKERFNWRVPLVGILNYRTWILMASYGFSFGLELTLDNNLSAYFSGQFGFSATKAGRLAAIFGLFNIISRPTGGLMSDFLGRRYGIRARQWWLFTVQVLGCVFCIIFGTMENTYAGTIVFVCLFSFFIEAACGALYGVYPFVSHRAMGVVCGMVGAGGNTGSAIAQAIFFTPATLATYDGYKWMGVMALGVTMFQLLIWFPMWGGMILPARKGATEEDYYFSEYSKKERDLQKHLYSAKFADNSRSQRGLRRLNSETAIADDSTHSAGPNDTAHGASGIKKASPSDATV